MSWIQVKPDVRKEQKDWAGPSLGLRDDDSKIQTDQSIITTLYTDIQLRIIGKIHYKACIIAELLICSVKHFTGY